uniref:Ribosomal protein L29 n=1 Tax=Ditylenchus dipsaci TaxID=166011 RepID=A0A915EJA7_9BILA
MDTARLIRLEWLIIANKLVDFVQMSALMKRKLALKLKTIASLKSLTFPTKNAKPYAVAAKQNVARSTSKP